ncbi:hypothetical protein LTR37_009150 [Vermiconidia calcicola]|uniref:Uncharacterized protein n=1 Tax=Vermiconidia calcicola TaxID=1690605 RepID=A0ACC3N8V3_9PEZI|nr:hypothetical protein LTR37_009150 [Vermiconidia calcicola]
MASTSKRKVVLITGATGGIGKATALAFAKEGCYDLALHYNSANEQTRNKLATEIKDVAESSSINFAFFQADLGNYDSVRQMHKQATCELGDIDILFNNAGSNGGQSGVQSLADVPIDVFEQSWRINTGSGILLAQLCLPHMEAQGWGRIIFDSSVAAFTGGVVGPHYASSKSAQHGFVHWLANNVAKKGVTVNAVAPALIGGTNMIGDASDEEAQKKIAQRIPVGRLGRPEEVAETVMWMVKVAYVTNKVIGVDGGYYPH